MKVVKANYGMRKTKLFRCEVYVRENLVPVEASEQYYKFVGSNSYVSISELVEPEVGEALLQATKPLKEPLEFITDISNLVDEVHTVYLRLENSDRMEKEGQPLYKVVMFDFRDAEERYTYAENHLEKYRRFMGWSGYYFFEYVADTEQFTIYKNIAEKAFTLVDEQIDTYFEKKMSEMEPGDRRIEQIQRFIHYLKGRKSEFELEISSGREEGDSSCIIKGGTLYKDLSSVVGVLVPIKAGEEQAYFLSPAARDAATGLLNKRASAEYTVNSLEAKDGKTRWIIMLDIDNFKTINDTFGHLFGDLVIQKMAEIMKQVVNMRGVVGRFGGDEFYILLEKIQTRDALKTLLKTMTKKFLHEFAPQLNVTVSIGVSRYPENGTDYETLIGMADKALYIAKEKGKNRHIIYDEALHGRFETENHKVKSLKYTLSAEKRTKALGDLYCQLGSKGVAYLKEPGVMAGICEILDIDAVTVYIKGGAELFCASDRYAKDMPESIEVLQEERYLKLYDENGVYVENKVSRLAALIPEAYAQMKSRDIASTIQCMGKKDGVPYAWMSFDVLENSKKWNDNDICQMSVLGRFCCSLFCKE